MAPKRRPNPPARVPAAAATTSLLSRSLENQRGVLGGGGGDGAAVGDGSRGDPYGGRRSVDEESGIGTRADGHAHGRSQPAHTGPSTHGGFAAPWDGIMPGGGSKGEPGAHIGSGAFFGSSPVYGRSLTHMVRPVVLAASGQRSSVEQASHTSSNLGRSPETWQPHQSPAPVVGFDMSPSSLASGSVPRGSLASTGGSALRVPLLAGYAPEGQDPHRTYTASAPAGPAAASTEATFSAPMGGLGAAPRMPSLPSALAPIDPLHAASLRPLPSPRERDGGGGGGGGGAPEWLGPPAGVGAPVGLHAAQPGKRAVHAVYQDAGTVKALVFGFINALVGIPALIAFTAIVFQDKTFTPYVGPLCRFFFFSSAIHQSVFLLMSAMPFAIGQVQDVGLIFLSSMGSAIAVACRTAHLPAQVALGTTLVTFSISTVIVGVLTTLVGKWRLAQLVMYVPLPVVGGYLGYVGYFCIAGGAALAANIQIDTFVSWAGVLNVQCLIKLAPLAATVLVLMLTMEHVSHPLALPTVLVAIPAAFHLVLLASGVTLKEAQDAGWVMPPTEGSSQPFWELWDMFNLRPSEGWAGLAQNTYWPAVLAQVPKMAGLFLVVCFGSCMDIAAIQQDVPHPLDFDAELVTVGTSNMVSALLGAGYTGSYIFSQTVFTLRAGVFNRLNGVVVVVAELAVFATPFSVVQFLPSFYFGALLLWFGVDIVRDWLVLSYRKLSTGEYVLLWATFLAIMLWGLEAGIGAGCIMATIGFAYKYAESTVSNLSAVPASSGNMHGYSRQAVLEVLMPRCVVALTLGGFIFFGNSIPIISKIEKIAANMLSSARDEAREAQAPPEALASPGKAGWSPANTKLGGSGSGFSAFGSASAGDSKSDTRRLALAALDHAPMFIILDFRLVPTLDATAAKTFAALLISMVSQGIQVVVCGISTKRSADMRRLLAAHGMGLVTHAQLGGGISRRGSGAISRRGSGGGGRGDALAQPDNRREVTPVVPSTLQPGQVWEFSSVEAAARYCEDAILAVATTLGLCAPEAPTVTLEDVLAAHAAQASFGSDAVAAAASVLSKHMSTATLYSGQVLFREGVDVDAIYILCAGHVHLSSSQAELQGQAGGAGAAAAAAASNDPTTQRRHSVEYGPGCLVAVSDFYLHRAASATARCTSPLCQLMVLQRSTYRRLLAEQPAALGLLQFAVTRALCLDLATSMELVERMQ